MSRPRPCDSDLMNRSPTSRVCIVCRTKLGREIRQLFGYTIHVHFKGGGKRFYSVSSTHLRALDADGVGEVMTLMAKISQLLLEGPNLVVDKEDVTCKKCYQMVADISHQEQRYSCFQLYCKNHRL